MPTVFNGPAKTITMDPAEPNILTRDLYSDWKRWVVLSDNSKYLPAFSAIGGDPTVPGQTAPAYYFVSNGWKVIVDGFDASFSFNLYADDASSPVITQNGGTAQLFNSDVGIVESTVEQALDYGGRIIIDFGVGTSGQNYPFGTPGQPVNNIADAIAVANLYGFTHLYIREGMATVTEDLSGFEVEGAGPMAVHLILDPAGEYVRTRFVDIMITGEGKDTDRIQADRCSIGNLSHFNGFLIQCGLFGTLAPSISSDTVIWQCASQVPGMDSPTIDMVPGVPTRINVRDFSGGLRVINCDHPDDVATFEYSAGRCRLDTTCSDGLLSIRGNCDLVDNSTGTTVDTTAHMQSYLKLINDGIKKASLLVPHTDDMS